MKIKQYTGSSLDKIRSVIFKELGEDAVIINIKKNYETNSENENSRYKVIAAVDLDLDPKQSPPLLTDTQIETLQNIINIQNKYSDSFTAMADNKVKEETTNTGLLKKMLSNIHENWQTLLAQKMKDIKKDTPVQAENLQQALSDIIPTASGILFRKTNGQRPDIYAIIGPTGVGKTTTLAKLAAKAVLGKNLNVGLITTDTFRVAAVDQLREYSALLGIEMAVAFSSEELKLQIDNFTDKDLVFIDTPGHSQFDIEGIKSITEHLSKVEDLNVLLVVPANIRDDDALHIFDSYKALNPSALIISKTDEASKCDGLSTLLEKSQLPVIYLTDGQRVPEDIHIASAKLVASLIIPYLKHETEPVKIGANSHE